MHRREFPRAAGVRPAQLVALPSRTCGIPRGPLLPGLHVRRGEARRDIPRGIRRRAMYPSEKGKGARWAQWKKETNEQKPKDSLRRINAL